MENYIIKPLGIKDELGDYLYDVEDIEIVVQPIIENKEPTKPNSEGSSTGTGALYEFFTPTLVAEKMWDLAYKHGFSGNGTVLEPAAGNGRLLQFAPDLSKCVAFEINPDNVADLQKQFPDAEVYDQSFEIAYLQAPRYNSLIKSKTKPTWLTKYPFELVIANPPYGKYMGLYSSYFPFKGQFEHFFIEYTIKLLQPGGVGVFLVPSSFLRNGAMYTEVKKRILEMAKLVEAYRLPANIFEKTSIGTDIIVFKKK